MLTAPLTYTQQVLFWQNERRESSHSTLTAKRSNNYIHQTASMGLAEWEEEEEEKMLTRYKNQDSLWILSGFSGIPEILADSLACWRFSQESDAVSCGACDCTKVFFSPFFLSFFFPFSLGDGPFCVEVIIIIITKDLISANN
jgi:hypothetical protein